MLYGFRWLFPPADVTTPTVSAPTATEAPAAAPATPAPPTVRAKEKEKDAAVVEETAPEEAAAEPQGKN